MYFTKRSEREGWGGQPTFAMLHDRAGRYIALAAFRRRRRNRADLARRELRDSRVTAGETAVGVASTSTGRKPGNKKNQSIFIQPPGLRPISIYVVRSDSRIPAPYRVELKKRTSQIRAHFEEREAKRREATVAAQREAANKAHEKRLASARMDLSRFPASWKTKKPRLQPWDTPEERTMKEEFFAKLTSCPTPHQATGASTEFDMVACNACGRLWARGYLRNVRAEWASQNRGKCPTCL